MASPALYRRKNDIPSPLPDQDPSWDTMPVFASSVASQTNATQRRGKGGASDARSGLHSSTSAGWSPFANGWKEEEGARDDTIWEAEASGSNASYLEPRPLHNVPLNGLTSSTSHPLSTPTETWRHSHDESRSSSNNRPVLTRRTNSADDSRVNKSRRGAWDGIGKGKGRVAEDDMEVIVHEVCMDLKSKSKELLLISSIH